MDAGELDIRYLNELLIWYLGTNCQELNYHHQIEHLLTLLNKESETYLKKIILELERNQYF